MIRIIPGFALVLALSGAPAGATSIIYTVNQTIGLGSVIGTIQTDGTIGTLAAADVTGFDLTVKGGGASVVLTGADSIVVLTGANVSASATKLTFNYDGPDGFLLFQQGSYGTGMKYYCNASVSGSCYQGASAVPQSYNSASAQFEGRAGAQVIASVAGTVPEPATWMMMLGGFALVAMAMRRRMAGTAVGRA